MPEEIRKHLIASSLDMVQMTRRGPVDEGEANLDLWNAVHGPVSFPVPFAHEELAELIQQIRGGDEEQLKWGLTELVGRSGSDLIRNATLALVETLMRCCEWVDDQPNSASGDQMLTQVRDRLQD